MMVPPMRKIELLVLKDDVSRVVACLGRQGCMQLPRTAVAAPDSTSRRMFRSLQECRAYLQVPDLEDFPPDVQVPDQGLYDEAAGLVETVSAHRGHQDSLAARLASCLNALGEAQSFMGLGLSFRELSRTSFLAVRTGRLGVDRQAGVRQSLGDRAFMIPLWEADLVAFVSSRKSRYALDQELDSIGFRDVDLPPDKLGLPEEVVAGLKDTAESLKAELSLVDTERQAMALEMAPRLRELLAVWAAGVLVDCILVNSVNTGHVYRLQGWMPATTVHATMDRLREITQGRLAVRIFDPSELESVKSGSETVPVQLVHGALTKGFERMVVSYGTPLYGTVDPTPFVAVSFIALFALMFGDVGQGFMIALGGLVLWRGSFVALERLKVFAPVLVCVGAASMFTGLLYGSVFSDERVLVPFSRWVSGLYGPPQDRIISIMPVQGPGKLLEFFAFTLGVGVVLNSLGMVVNMINLFRLGHPSRAIFSKTGLCGALFLWYAVFLAIRILRGGSAVMGDVIGLALPLCAMVLGPAIMQFLRPKEEREGFGTVLVESLVQILESVSYFFSNSLSFLRVGAFALSHAVLSLIIFTLSDLAWAATAVGPVFGVLILIAGNLLILVLEGMIVAIQAIRLQYYEFFSKFFTETGELFRPFHFDYKEVLS